MIRSALYLFIFMVVFLQCNNGRSAEEPYDTIATQELASFIGLTLLECNPVFSRGMNFVYNDTLVGVSHDNHKYFYKSLAENGPVIFIDLIDPPRDIFQRSSHYPDKYPSVEIAYFRNGYFYFVTNYIWKLNIDGTLKNYIGKDALRKKLVGFTDLIVYEEYAIIKASNGIFILDMETEKLIWHYIFSQFTNIFANPTLVGNKLTFIDRSIVDNESPQLNNKNTILVCVDLENLEIIWERKFEETYLGAHGGSLFALPNNGRDVIGLMNYDTKATYFIDLKNGDVLLEKDSIYIYNLGQDGNRYSYTNYFSPFEDYVLYAFNLQSNALVKLNIAENTEIWTSGPLEVVFLYNDFVVTRDWEFHAYVVLNKHTGEILKRFPIQGKFPVLELKEQYIRIGSSIYK